MMVEDDSKDDAALAKSDRPVLQYPSIARRIIKEGLIEDSAMIQDLALQRGLCPTYFTQACLQHT